jgi:anti-sigma regulatory factor (Ser/Thr protein kinase)
VRGRRDIQSRLDLRVGAEATSLARVRQLLTGFLAEHELGERREQDALLVANELTANAIEHASTDDDHVEIAVWLEPESLLIRVLDPARTASRPVPLERDESRESGRGMLIVNELGSWSERLTGGRREVTAQLPLQRDPAKRQGS